MLEHCNPITLISHLPDNRAAEVNAGLLTLLDAATKAMQDFDYKMIKNVLNIEKYQHVSLLYDQFVLE